MLNFATSTPPNGLSINPFLVQYIAGPAGVYEYTISDAPTAENPNQNLGTLVGEP